MKQRIVSLCLMLALCLGLLPVTAGAAAPKWQELYVGGVRISATGYWATDNAGNVTPAGDTQPADNYIHYDADTNTLTLHNAWIKKELPYSPDIPASSYLAGWAIGVLNEYGDAALTIRLEGDNVIGDVGQGICLLSTSGGKAGLTITGGGILDVSGHYKGILVQNNTGDAGLTIQGEARVAAATIYGWGVTVQSAADKDADLTVDGASLTAAGAGSNGAGIWFQIGTGYTSSKSYGLSIKNSAIIKASGTPKGIDSNSSIVTTPNGDGIVFDNGVGYVYGTVTLSSNLTIGEGESLSLVDGATLNANDHYVIVDGGTVSEEIKNSLGDSLKIAPSITTESLPSGTVGVPYTATLEATGTEPIKWGASGTWPAGLSPDKNTGEISGTPTTAGDFDFQVIATNGWGTDDIKDFGITIAEASDISVTGVTLDPDTLDLTEGETATLIATITPDNATNKNVTWSSDNAAVATVDANGTVTAKSAGTATITATAADGSGKTATCEVTVTHGTLTHTAEKPATCTEDGKAAYYTCETCGKYFEDEAGNTEIMNLDEYGIIPATGHELTKTAEKAATCTAAGKAAYYTCGTCGKHFSDEEGKNVITDLDGYGIIPATGHSYGTPAWTWAADGKSCTATFTCTKCDHEEKPTATVTSQVETAAGCTTTGTTDYTAKVTFGGRTYQSTTQLHDIPAAGHKLAKTAEKPATCTAAGKAAYYTCETCSRHFADEAARTEITNLDEYGVLPATGHTYVKSDRSHVVL